MKRKLYFFILIFTIMVIVIVSNITSEKDTYHIAKEYLEKEGYIVLSYEVTFENYVLTKELLLQQRYMLLWSLQTEDPIKYLNEEVNVEKFIIKNHKLDNFGQGTFQSKGQTEVRVFVIDKKVVGGNSAPVADRNILLGGPWSLDGKTLQEIHSTDWDTWINIWYERYE